MKKRFYNFLVYFVVSSSLWASSAYQARDFTYLLGKVQGFDEALLKMHFTLYQGYVKNSNQLRESLNEMNTNGLENSYAYGALKRRLGWELDGMRLHEYYFENLGGAGGMPSAALMGALKENFGSFEAWMKDFKGTGMMRGVGWVVLYLDSKEQKLYNMWINEHDLGHLADGKVLLVMDVWEHAYITQYALNRADYIEAFFKSIDWDRVSQRYKL